jgi:hypothetical protein
MSDDYKTTIVKNITGSVPALAVVVGAAFTLLGLAGGVTYRQLLPMQETTTRVLSGALGIALIVFGFVRTHAVSTTRLNPRDFGIKIQFPTPGTRVNTVDVGGTIEKGLPDGHCLRVFRIFPGSNNFVPLSKARIDIHAKTWVAERCHIGGNKDDQRFYAAYICGPSAEALIDFHNEAVSAHRTSMDEYENATGKKTNFLPSVAGRTTDMYECDRVSVVRS